MIKPRVDLLTILLILGISLVMSGIILGWFAVPNFLEDRIKLEAQLVNGSDTWRKWERVRYPISIRFHLFNITNPKAILRGERIELQECGPYVYREKRVKFDVKLSAEDNTVSYRQKITYHFDPAASNGTEDDLLNVANVPLIAVAHDAYVRRTGYDLQLAQLLIRLLTSRFGNESIVKESVSVREIIFGGWKMSDFYASIPAAEMPKDFQGLRFGFYRHRNGSDDGTYVINTGQGDHSNFGKVLSWNGMTELPWWHSKGFQVNSTANYCNKINGSDGSLYPPFITKETTLRMFITGACRSVHMTFNAESMVKGIPGFRFTMPTEVAANPVCNRNNACFCQKQSSKVAHHCSTGTVRIFGCKHGAPIITSNPHFLDGGNDLFDPVILSPPDRDMHETFVEVEPLSGVLLRASKKIQLNVEVQRLPRLSLFGDLNFENLTDNPSIVLPMFWAEEYAEIDNESAEELYGKLIRTVKIAVITRLVAVASGTAATMLTGFVMLRSQRLRQRQQRKI